MAKKETETLIVTGENIAPSLDTLVTDAVSDDVRSGGNEALDQLHIRITGPADDGDSVSFSDEPRRPRGRPAGSGTRKTGERKSKSKAEIASDLARVTAELEAERARNNANAVNELAQQMEMAIGLCFGMLAAKRGPHWSIKPEESKNIGQTGALALAPHADALRKYSPWGMFAATLGGAFYVRIQEDRRLVALHGVATPEAV